jgi:glycerol-3-phosphate dehydrogenase
VIPWGAHSLVGTTDTDHPDGPDAVPTVEASDVAYLLETVNHYFPGAALVPGDVVSAFAGFRPLIAPPPGSGARPSDVSREEEVYVAASGLVTIGGGKLTTYRLIAAKVVDQVVANLVAAGDGRRFGPSTTASAPFPGGAVPPETIAADLAARNGHSVAAATLRHLASRYGSRAGAVAAVAARDAALAAPILPAQPDPRAEVVAAVEYEWAMTLEDVLRRRTQVALFDPEQGGAAAADVATLMAPALEWDDETARRSAEAYAEATARERARWR